MKEDEIRDFFFKAKNSYGLKHAKKELSVGRLRIDIFAIDANHSPYIIEFKKAQDRRIVGQAAQYLALIPTHKEEIEKKLNFYHIKWSDLKAICIAPEFDERDYESAKYEPLKGRIHFYTYKPVLNSRKQIFSLNLSYDGPDAEEGPLSLPEKVVDSLDVKAVQEKFNESETRKARREYYSMSILPLLEKICEKLKGLESLGFYSHISFWNTWFSIGFGLDKRKSHQASVILAFGEEIWYGFDLIHALKDAQKIVKVLSNPKTRQSFIEKTLLLEEYSIWLPNTGISESIFIDNLNEKGLNLLLSNYQPEKMRDCYFRIYTYYDEDTLKVDEAVELINSEIKRFNYIFDLVRK